MVSCEFCGGKKDRRARMCGECRSKLAPARLGTGKGWYLHEKTGYMICSINGRQYYQHRFVMEQHLGRPLTTKEHVHHKDGDKTNNDLGNLELISASEHGRHHIEGRAKSMSAKAHYARWGYVSYV